MLPVEEAKLHVNDLSLQRGYAVFDFFRMHGSVPLFIEDHLLRFSASAEKLRLAIPYSTGELKTIVYDLIEKNGVENAGIKLLLTGGYTDDGITPGRPNLVITQQKLSPPTDEQREGGIKLMTITHQRQLPGVKSTDYLMPIWLQPQLESNDANDALYTANDNVLECPRSNFFIVTREGVIVTPGNNILQGITRKYVLQLAREHYKVEERDLAAGELAQAAEAFITSTTKEIVPVKQIDGIRFEPSIVSKRLQQLFSALKTKWLEQQANQPSLQ